MWGIALSILGGIGLSPVPLMASLLGTPEAALNLLISIFMGYPLAIVYHKYVRQNTNLRHLYFILTGLDIAWFNFGYTLYHNSVPILAFYICNLYFGPGQIHSIITFIFNVFYLVSGYIYTESEDYDITWTMPQCVLTLKLIALSFDLWDGKKLKEGKSEQLSVNQQKNAVTELPTMTELFGFVYFPACFLVGPQFSFKRYTEFVNDVYPTDDKIADATRYRETVKTFGLGILYLSIYQFGGSMFYMDYMMSEEFAESSIFYRHIYCGIWAHIALCKYISCWLLTEGACILFGLSYNGTEKDKPKWDGCKNIKLMKFELATRFQHYIDSFNCNTNHFAAEYIYKRLKFLGNRNLSQGATLFFLALWHGVNSGYYATFLNEFLVIFMEKGLEDLLKKTVLYEKLWSTPAIKYTLFILLKLYTIVFMGWCLAPFDLKIGSKWVYLYSKLWFSGYVLFVPWAFCYKPVLKYFFKKYNLYKKVE